ncbi:unnamed protein product, partial [Vitis vinifera]
MWQNTQIDTTSTTVEWAMAELLQHPQTMQKFQEELEQVVGIENIVEESHLFQLPYLDAVIKEALRLHPPLPLLIPHSPSTSCIISGYTIPKGSRILVNAWAMQRDPEAWGHPLEFKPERFLEDAASADYQGNNFNFLPFGSGRRICAGLPLAERMLPYAAIWEDKVELEWSLDESLWRRLNWWENLIFLIFFLLLHADGEGKNKSKESKDFLQFMLELMHQGDDKTSVSITQLKALFMDMVVAATDTTSTTVEWAMAELLQHPQTMQKVQEELEQVVGIENIVEESHLFQLPYLDAVIKEALRLHPPLPLLIPHSPSTSCIISGYTIPKGSRILVNAWAMQRDPEAWGHPLEFKPERFLEDAASADYQGNNFNFLPFGSGRRICAGLPLLERMLPYVLAFLLHSFDWKLLDGRTRVDFEERLAIVSKKNEPLLAIPTARLSNLFRLQFFKIHAFERTL